MKKERTIQFLLKSDSLGREAEVRHFEWYNARIADQEIKEMLKMIDETKEILSAEQYYQELNFSPFQSSLDSLEIIQTKIDELKEKKRIEEEKKRIEAENFKKMLGSGGVGYKKQEYNVSPYIHDVPNFTLIKLIQEERERIDNLLVRIIYQASLNDDLLANVRENPESSRLVSVSIIATLLLFFSGVIYPLSFLPLKPNEEISLSVGVFFDILFSFKGSFLVVLSVIFGSLMVKFFLVNISLRHDKRKMEQLNFFASVENYSLYFKNYFDNNKTTK
jgi:hypothetical protein